MDNFTEAEQKRLQLIQQIQKMYQTGISIREITRRFQINRQTTKKYLKGDPMILCRTNKRSNQNVRNGLKLEIKICLVKNGYPPQYSPEVFNKVMEQVENFEEYSGTEGIGNEASTSGKIYEYKPEYKVMMVAEDSSKYGDSKNNQ